MLVPALLLEARRVEKPWGRTTLPPGFDPVPPAGAPIGEIIFDSEEGGPRDLILKYLFTSEKLSIQVHPSNVAAQARGLRNGKDEAWVVIEAEPDATLGLGLKAPATIAELRRAALDGSIEGMVEWSPVRTGDCIYSPGGTIHAIGAGVAIVEVQQNSDVTYRLFDYGRPRELHLEAGLGVVDLNSKPQLEPPVALGSGRTRLASGPAFQVERIDGWSEGLLSPPKGAALWLLPLAGNAWLDEEPLAVGGCWLLLQTGSLRLEAGGALLLAYPGGETRHVWRA
jgi:mannose-6-phosphate isomerase